MELLTVKDLTFTYPGAAAPALTDVSFSLKNGGFYLLCGYTGCGKTTLLRLLKPELAPFGEKTGEVVYAPVFGDMPAPHEIGMVTQDPNEQIVTDRVWHELAFGLENMGLPAEEIRIRTGETASYFGLAHKFDAPAESLSGGEKQLLSLAAAVITGPKLLLLDEPTSQLDPITAMNFLDTLKRVNRDFGITVLLAEHRLEEIFSLADTVFAMDGGRLIAAAPPAETAAALKDSRLFAGFPSAARLWKALERPGPCPVNVREGKAMLEAAAGPSPLPFTPEEKPAPQGEEALSAKGLWFRYEKDGADVLKNLRLSVRRGEIFGILGANGVGKTTLLQVLAGLRRPYHGGVRLSGEPIERFKRGSLYKAGIALLPQDPKTVFLKDTVRADLETALLTLGHKKADAAARAQSAAEEFDIAPLLDRNPYDLSGGERQKCALAKLLLTEPRVLLLDEPTKGLDAYTKENLARLLASLSAEGRSVVLVTHDVEFAARVSNTCALLFFGELLATGSPHAFFAGNTFYTTAAARMAHESVPGAIFTDEAAAAVKARQEAQGGPA